MMSDGLYFLKKNGKWSSTIPADKYRLIAYGVLTWLHTDDSIPTKEYKTFEELKDDIRQRTGFEKTIILNVLDDLVEKEHVDVCHSGLSITEKGKKLLYEINASDLEQI